jgi:hypothetical protein
MARPDTEERRLAMRDLVAVEFVSVDGVVEAPEKWTTPYIELVDSRAFKGGVVSLAYAPARS